MNYARDFLRFVDQSPSPFHAVDQAIQKLVAAGFKPIKESDAWNLLPGEKYFFTRNHSAIVGFTIGQSYKSGNGFSIVGAHTDSPCLKVKPISKRERGGYLQVGVEVYGGGLWHTWFDRDLSLAGKVLISNNNRFEHRLVHLKKALLRIPTLAIHLDRTANDGFNFNKEVQLTPVLAQSATTELNKVENDKHHPQLLEVIAKELNVSVAQIEDFELCLYDTQSAAIGGLNDEFIHSSRLDNLMMSFCSLEVC
jgi:aspartyl aminopeptidase